AGPAAGAFAHAIASVLGPPLPERSHMRSPRRRTWPPPRSHVRSRPRPTRRRCGGESGSRGPAPRSGASPRGAGGSISSSIVPPSRISPETLDPDSSVRLVPACAVQELSELQEQEPLVVILVARVDGVL